MTQKMFICITCNMKKLKVPKIKIVFYLNFRHFRSLKALQTWLRLCCAMYRIIGIIDGHYIVQTPKGLKKPKVLNLVLNLFQY